MPYAKLLVMDSDALTEMAKRYGVWALVLLIFAYNVAPVVTEELIRPEAQ